MDATRKLMLNQSIKGGFMKFDVVFGEDYITIIDECDNDVLYWTQAEWEEDSSIVFSIVNAVRLALTCPVTLKEQLNEFIRGYKS